MLARTKILFLQCNSLFYSNCKTDDIHLILFVIEGGGTSQRRNKPCAFEGYLKWWYYLAPLYYVIFYHGVFKVWIKVFILFLKKLWQHPILFIIRKIHNTIEPRLTHSNRPKTTKRAIFVFTNTFHTFMMPLQNQCEHFD